MKKFLKILAIVIGAIIAIAALFLAYLTIREYKPDDIEQLDIRGTVTGKELKQNEEMTVLTWNVGYCALGKDSDFVMDGGGNAPSADEDKVNQYMSEICEGLNEEDCDIYMLQEVDVDSSRSFGIDQRDSFSIGNDVHALNYSCDFVPFPWPPFGKINSGIFTTTTYDIESAERISLPCPFSWPLRVANLKRCMMVSYMPIEGSDKKFVLINFHLEAYDSGEGKIAQTKQLLKFMEEEYKKGNYVIAGGDWNQVFPDSLLNYPDLHSDIWKVGHIDIDMLPEGFITAFDSTEPTCRLLNQPYNPADTVNTQYYVIDGFICSPNVRVNDVETINKGFASSDHNPVKLTFTLKGE